jgi:hypothetical protein
MKKGYSRKKLGLNKQTIVHLDNGKMRGIHGGSDPETLDHTHTSHPVPTCSPCPDTLDTEPTDP